MTKPHIHAALIKQWADGATIQFQSITGDWKDVVDNLPFWAREGTYRVKPEPKPDVVVYKWINENGSTFAKTFDKHDQWPDANLMLVIDGETGQLKAAQVLAQE